MPWLSALAAAVGLVAPVLAALWPAIRVSRVPVVEPSEPPNRQPVGVGSRIFIPANSGSRRHYMMSPRNDGIPPMSEQLAQPDGDACRSRPRAGPDRRHPCANAIEVVDDPAALAIAGRATIPDPKQPGAVVFPTNVEEVSTIVKLANEFRVPVWPVSKGRNWGYGSATPEVDNTVVLHLERMNRISEVNEDLAYAVIEPGVTYRQLKEHLLASGSRLWCDCTDGPPEGSVLGNALERGMGVTHYADHFGTLCGLEVVLADGSIIRTGGGAFGRCPTWNTHKWGVGPYIEGLFSQSNFGVVVKAGIWLFPQPESYCAFTFDLAREEDFPRLVDAVRELTLAGLLTAGVHMINDICALSVISQYPPGLAERASRLPDDVLLEQRQPVRGVELELWRWNSRHEGVGEECPASADAAAQRPWDG